MKAGKFLLLFFGICLAISCDKSLFDTGVPVSKKIRITDSFSRLVVNKTFDILLVQDTINMVVITAGKNLLPDVHAFVKENALWLDYGIRYNWTRKYEKIKAEVHLISIPYIQAMEPSRFTTKDTFKTDHFSFGDWGKFSEIDVTIDANSCAIDMSQDNFGSYKLRGKASNAIFTARGSSTIDASDLITHNCTVESRTIAAISVNTENVLTAIILSSGNVFYSGKPKQISLQESSTGKLIER